MVKKRVTIRPHCSLPLPVGLIHFDQYHDAILLFIFLGLATPQFLPPLVGHPPLNPLVVVAAINYLQFHLSSLPLVPKTILPQPHFL